MDFSVGEHDEAEIWSGKGIRESLGSCSYFVLSVVCCLLSFDWGERDREECTLRSLEVLGLGVLCLHERWREVE